MPPTTTAPLSLFNAFYSSSVNPTPAGRTAISLALQGQRIFPTGFIPTGAAGSINGTPAPVGGLSGVTYDAVNNRYYAISDDRAENAPARFYTFTTNPGTIATTGVNFTNVTALRNESGNLYSRLSLDPEGIALTGNGTVFVSSEGEANPAVGRVTNPFVNEYNLTTGAFVRSLLVPRKFNPIVVDTNGNGVVDAGDTQTSGVRNNLAFESLTISPDQRYPYTATENALLQDGPAASVTTGSRSRIIQYNLVTGQPEKEYLYTVDPVALAPNPATAFATNGLVDLLAIDDRGTFLALERSFSTGAVTPGNTGNTIRIYEISLQGATDISAIDSLSSLTAAQLTALQPVQKRLVLNLDALNLPTGLDNVEGLAFGPKLADGRQSIVLVSDNNFSPTQFTQILTLGADLVPTAAPTVETPSNSNDPTRPFSERQDSDDPAIYVNATDASKSLVITAIKNGGLQVYNLGGELLQTLNPGNIRYNNVDLIYNFAADGFEVAGQPFDLAIATDRNNDKLVVFRINPDPGTDGQYLEDITEDSATLFQSQPFALPYSASTRSAYGIATYRSPESGEFYVFANRRQTGDVAQYRLVASGEQIGFELVRQFTLPTVPGRSAQTEGMVVDQETGFLYIGQEQVGLWKFYAEPDGGTTGTLIDRVRALGGSHIANDVEGLTIYYGADGKGYLLASSQGDSTFAVYSREGNNDFLGRFAVGNNGAIDSVQESDGADVINVPLGPNFPNGLFITQDGRNLPAQTVNGENVNTNFKFVPWENIASALPNPLNIDTTSYNPRAPQARPFLDGVASGDVTQTSAVLWTRSNFTGEVYFEISTDPGFADTIAPVAVSVTNPLQPVKVDITELSAGTQYYYRAVSDASGATSTGQFRTAAEIGTRTGLKFGVSGDWRGELAPYPAIANAAEKNLDFFVLHGDTIYSDFPSPAVRNPDSTEKAQAQTLDEFRAKHAEVYGDRFGQNFWSELRASTPVLATIDDHEVVNDFEGGKNLATASAAEQALYGATSGLVNDSPLYENGLQAFQEYNPIRDEFYGETGDPRTAGERKLYRYNTFGSDAATYVLDARSFRDSELPAANPANPIPFLVNSFDPRRTLLGRPQVEDLKHDLLDAEANGVSWKFVMIPEPIQNLGVVGAGDRYEGYAAERTEILKFITDNQIQNVVFVSADIHSTLVNNLTYQLAPGQAQIATSAFEITTGSVGFDAPFGPTVVDLASQLGFLTPAQTAFYNALPVANDTDSLLNDKDDFIKNLVNQQLVPLGYDPLGLNDNLAIANGKINARLLQGDYLSTQTYGWTEFDIDPQSQKLQVTTYGIPYYTREQLEANPAAIASLTPTIVSQFEVTPEASAIRGTAARDTLIGTSGNDRLNGFAGNDRLNGGAGDDILTGGTGRDRFILARGMGTDTITDFTIGQDLLKLSGGLSVAQLTVSQGTGANAADTLVRVTGTSELLAILSGVQASAIGNSFVL